MLPAPRLLAAHEASGRIHDVAGLPTFVRDEGAGDVVLLVHGVPVSSWVWRRVIPALTSRGLRAVAPDLPGTGISGRPAGFDYTWTGLGRHLTRTVEALGLESFHLVVHDIGGPVRRGDGGVAFLRIMRSFETTEDKSALYRSVLAHARPVQVLWAADDPALPARTLGRKAAQAAGRDAPELLPGRHFLQEDSADAVAARIAVLVNEAG